MRCVYPVTMACGRERGEVEEEREGRKGGR